MSTFNDIEMCDANGETFRIDLPFEFSEWNKAVIRNCPPSETELSWEDIAGSIAGLIKEKSAG